MPRNPQRWRPHLPGDPSQSCITLLRGGSSCSFMVNEINPYQRLSWVRPEPARLGYSGWQKLVADALEEVWKQGYSSASPELGPVPALCGLVAVPAARGIFVSSGLAGLCEGPTSAKCLMQIWGTVYATCLLLLEQYSFCSGVHQASTYPGLISCTLMERFTFSCSASAALTAGWDQDHADIDQLLTACCALLQAVCQGLSFTGPRHRLSKGPRHGSVQCSGVHTASIRCSCSLQLECAREAGLHPRANRSSGKKPRIPFQRRLCWL